jgi:hypothetical protein
MRSFIASPLLRMVKSGGLQYDWGRRGGHKEFWKGFLEELKHQDDLDVNRRIILKCI